MTVKYPVLESEILNRGIKKAAIASSVRITPRSLNNKLQGITNFTWDEACRIQSRFFPDIPKDDLFSPSVIESEHSA
jgi:hypothetical protein